VSHAHAPPQMAKGDSKANEPVTREYTVNLHKRCHRTCFKKKAPKAVKQIREFAMKMMGTSDVRLDVKLNKAVWSQGVRNIPHRIRIVVSRRRNDDEDAKARRVRAVWAGRVCGMTGRELGMLRGGGIHGHTGVRVLTPGALDLGPFLCHQAGGRHTHARHSITARAKDGRDARRESGAMPHHHRGPALPLSRAVHATPSRPHDAFHGVMTQQGPSLTPPP
jgi:large subunit ribosomal protein L31e